MAALLEATRPGNTCRDFDISMASSTHEVVIGLGVAATNRRQRNARLHRGERHCGAAGDRWGRRGADLASFRRRPRGAASLEKQQALLAFLDVHTVAPCATSTRWMGLLKKMQGAARRMVALIWFLRSFHRSPGCRSIAPMARALRARRRSAAWACTGARPTSSTVLLRESGREGPAIEMSAQLHPKELLSPPGQLQCRRAQISGDLDALLHPPDQRHR